MFTLALQARGRNSSYLYARECFSNHFSICGDGTLPFFVEMLSGWSNGMCNGLMLKINSRARF
jgi:hypothetical protein